MCVCVYIYIYVCVCMCVCIFTFSASCHCHNTSPMAIVYVICSIIKGVMKLPGMLHQMPPFYPLLNNTKSV